MANNYTGSSFQFECGTEDNANTVHDWLSCQPVAWPETLLKKLEDHNLVEEFEEEETADGTVRFPVTIECYVDVERTSVVVSHEESIDLSTVTAVLDHAMQTMPEVQSPQAFEWASWCDKARLDEFGGGAVILRKGAEPEWMSSWDWVRTRLAEIKAEGAAESDAGA